MGDWHEGRRGRGCVDDPAGRLGELGIVELQPHDAGPLLSAEQFEALRG